MGEACREQGMTLDEAVDQAIEEQRTCAQRPAGLTGNGSAGGRGLARVGATNFIGYDRLDSDRSRTGDFERRRRPRAAEGDEVEV